MDAVWGLVLGTGLLLVWMSWWEPEPRREGRHPRGSTFHDRLVQAGIHGVSVAAFGVIALATAVVVLALVWSATRSLAVAACMGIAAVYAPFAWVATRAARRRSRLTHAWPDAVDTLASGIRAGLALPEALAALADRGPEDLRPAFAAFAEDYRASGRFDASLDALKARLADPVADRIVEAVRIARDVGGTEVGRVLRALARYLREEARIRGELEARQSWTVNAARLAVAAPWVLLAMLATRPGGLEAFDTPTGVMVLLGGAAASVGAYRLMRAFGRLPVEERVLR